MLDAAALEDVVLEYPSFAEEPVFRVAAAVIVVVIEPV